MKDMAINIGVQSDCKFCTSSVGVAISHQLEKVSFQMYDGDIKYMGNHLWF